MFFNFQPNFIEKYLWESVFFFFKFWSCDFFRETKIRIFGRHLFVLGVMVQLLYRNSYGKVLKNEWVQVDPPCAQTGVKSSLSVTAYFFLII